MSGILIAIEGIGGVGKTTVKGKIADFFQTWMTDIPLVETREPGGTGCAETLRKLLREGFPCGDKLTPMGVALLFNTARADLMAKVVQPALNAGSIVLTDRFCDTTFAYQSVVDGLPLQQLIAIHEAAIGLYPDVTFLLDAPAEVANGRLSEKEKATDRFDREGLNTQEAMRQVYLSLARAHPSRYIVIDANRSEDEVYAEIGSYLVGLGERVMAKEPRPLSGCGKCGNCKKSGDNLKVWDVTSIYKPPLVNQPSETLYGKLQQ